VTFKVYIPETGESATFDIPVPIEKVSDDGYTVWGIPMGTYAFPPNMEIWSSEPSGKYAARGGFLRAVCFDIALRTDMGVRLLGGYHLWYDYNGSIFGTPGSSSGGSTGRGWSWHSTGTGYRNAGGQGSWEAALDSYLSGGGCSYGWEIWIDGVQKCDEFGNVMT
jgi:hypothetical protein